MKRKISVLLTLIFCFGFFGVAYSEKTINDYQKCGIIRLHIIANSNDVSDQRLKLKIRDELISKGVFEGKADLEKVNEICMDLIKRDGKSYGVKSEEGIFYFPTKEYENIRLPAGNYRALRVVLGEGLGENWWCVMYPPLCFGASVGGKISKENEEKIKNMMTKEGFNIAMGEEIKFVPAFKIVELWQEIKEMIWHEVSDWGQAEGEVGNP